MMPKGLTDKLYWRAIDGASALSSMHCFKKQNGGGYVSLCGRFRKGVLGGGQHCNRPRAEMRCGACDGAEMKRRGWSESGPESGTVIKVTDDHLDAPDGAEVNGLERQGDRWIAD